MKKLSEYNQYNMPEPRLDPPDDKPWKCSICDDYEDGYCILMTAFGIDHEAAEFLSNAVFGLDVERINRFLQNVDYSKLDYEYFSNQNRKVAEIKRVIEFLRMVADHIEDYMNSIPGIRSH